MAFFQLTGAPIRMAVATVSGCSTGIILSLFVLIACTMGAEPAACIPVILGSIFMKPSLWNSSHAFPDGADVSCVSDWYDYAVWGLVV
jgi:hypothetical protein